MPRPSRSLAARLGLARDILESHYAQPATAIWRLFETEIVREYLRASGRGLDVGCGDGTLAAVLLSEAGAVRWTGVDIDLADAQLAAQQGVYETVYTASAAAVPEPDGSFDVIFSNSVLEHIGPLDDVLDEIRRVLRPGGRLVFTVPSDGFRRQLWWPRVLRAAGAHGPADRYVAALDRRVAHVNYLSEAAWRDRLRRHGLHMAVCVPYLSRRTIGAWETVANATGGVAYLITRGRATPRSLLQRSGTAGRSSSLSGTAAFVVLLPILALLALEQDPTEFGCLYIEATRT